MIVRLEHIVIHLWERAPYWRLSVFVALLFTASALGHLGYVFLGNPESDARLAVYQKVQEGVGLQPSGQQCEQIALAFDRLTDGDKARDAGTAAARRSRQCIQDIAASDQRFATLDQAVTGAQNNPKLIQAAVDAFEALNAFDRSRGRYHDQAALIAKAQDDAAAVAASDKRLMTLGKDAGSYQADPTADTALRLVETRSQITELDRLRADRGQQASLAVADNAAATVAKSRDRLARLTAALDAMNGPAAYQAPQELVAAAAAVTAFDRGVATPQQKQMLDQGASQAREVTFGLLRASVTAMDQTGTPADLQAVASLYGVLKDGSTNLTPEQRDLLAKGAAAAALIAASDQRLTELMTAATLWQQQGAAQSSAILPRLRAITPFDRARFDAVHKDASDMLARAEAILRGPELGLTQATKDRLGIYVTASEPSIPASQVAAALSNALRQAGFLVVPAQKDAALIATVTVSGPEDMHRDFSGAFVAWVVTESLTATVRWAANETTLFSETFKTTAAAQAQEDARKQALSAGVNAALSRFSAQIKN